ncbi:MAG: hypothetical protein Q8R36_04860 [bacterium]|nr:hypothetical protein [bacterium]
MKFKPFTGHNPVHGDDRDSNIKRACSLALEQLIGKTVIIIGAGWDANTPHYNNVDIIPRIMKVEEVLDRSRLSKNFHSVMTLAGKSVTSRKQVSTTAWVYQSTEIVEIEL